jgi:predicted MPP superfamily phosphohydrolase
MRAISYLTRRSLIHKGALAVVGGAILGRSGWIEAAELPMLKHVWLFHPALPKALDGLRIAQVADVHAGAFMPPERLARVRAIVEQLEPDLIVFTGDQLDRREVDAEIFVHGFAGVSAPLGVFGILGNHDHLAGGDLSVRALEAVGATPLVNQTALIERRSSRLLLAGVDDLDAPPGSGPDYSVLSAGRADFRVLLCHQPNGWAAGRLAGADITLSGHTHGGQIALPSRGVNLARLGTPFVAGPYHRGGSILYVSRGIGVGAVPLRFGAPPEVDLITLRRGPVASIA